MNEHYHISNGTIVNEGEQFIGGVIIRNGLIHEVYRGARHTVDKDLAHIDASGKWILPGVIDDQVHFRDPGLTHKGDISTESRAAVAGGVTSYMDMPNTLPPVLTQTLLEQKYEIASRTSLANYSFYMGASNSNLGEILRTDPSEVCGVKVFMGSSTGDMLVDDPDALKGIFSQSPLLVAVHCEDENTIQQNLAMYREQYGDNPPVEVHPRIRSEKACYLSSSLAVDLAKKHHTRLHILHLSTAREMALFDNTVSLENKHITAEVCVHHLWFSDRDYQRLGTKIKWNPAIKSENDRLALLNAVLDDKIDIIATDHAPHTKDEKGRSYFSAPSGGPLVQHSLVAMLELFHRGSISIEKIVQKMCHNPAILFQVDRRGFIREGYWADLAIVDPDAPWTVHPDTILYKCGWSPFEGELFHSNVTHTFVNGNLVYDQGKFFESIKGKRLKFNR